jgi:hypothetical protein
MTLQQIIDRMYEIVDRTDEREESAEYANLRAQLAVALHAEGLTR